ncbi:uncharacterized protein LOC127450705 [Myxocyprinus asiaticus]|uniref:uncharacterized protein LOC127450705 n=1 Tax=Myxocyprinus asiaticus TaxID=70543 RepID=UPI00222244A8|nr:uncharacterized protein LOC127450705 [Myxocyprinus asiaticus]XP_051570953.1 uncharacterized protein LOC127450705 [Myxocyprinus asiaticus]XP_051570954.1 uncharacterized protein LOC127450705 [Myxocyprinus asiaticus]
MAEEGRAVYVHGLPTDVDRERLRDKLLIYFLRARNGGGEVTSVSVTNATPVCALITFEESRVVQSVLRHHPHILQLDGREYELSLSLPSQELLSLNKVILDMTVTIDCSQLPQGTETLNVLQCKFPGLHMQPGLLQQTCTFQGIYSEVQGALSYMKKFLTPNYHLLRAENPDFSGNSRQAPEKREDHGSQKHQIRTSFAHQSPGLHTGDLSSVPMVGLGQEHYEPQDSTEALTQLERHTVWTEKSKMEQGAFATDLEDISLIMEADVFAYLQNNKEYRRILHNHGVQVVHVTSEGVTTLYLQSEVPTGLGDKQNMRQAHKELRQLYQQQESCLRKDKLQRSAIYLPGGLTAALKNVQSVLPNVLLSYDQDNIYIVGERSEVSQAKQMLMLRVEEGVVGSSTAMPPSSSSSSSPEYLERGQQAKRISEVNSSMIPKLIGTSSEGKREGGKEYKLAARFKSSGLGGDPVGIAAKMDMLTLATNSQSTPPSKSILGTVGTLSNEMTGEGTEAFKMTGPSCTGEDVLFRNLDPLSFVNAYGTTSNTSKAKPNTSTGFTSTLKTGVKTASNTIVNAAPSATISVPTSISSLRRSNSFSGQPYLKEQMQENQITAGSMINAHVHQRIRSNSLSEDSLISTVEAELSVSSVMWSYMKEAYCNQLDSMKSDLEISEKQAGRSNVSVILKGSESSEVEECHRQLLNLVAMVATDFCVQELCLTELGVVEKDKLFEACCSNVRSCFRKVVLHPLKDRVLLLGPKLLCSQVSGIFKDIFPGNESNLIPQMKTFHPQQGVDLGATNASSNTTEVQMSKSTKINQSKSAQSEKELSFQETNQMALSNGNQTKCKSGGQLIKQKSTALEKLEKPRSMMDEFSNTNSFSQSTDASEEQTGLKNDGQTSLTLKAHEKKDTSMTLKQANLLSKYPSEHCVCGASGTDVKRTNCGVILCPICLPLHSHCRVCGKEEIYSQKKVLEDPVLSYGSKDVLQNQMHGYQAQEKHLGKEDGKEQKGIQGTMTCSEMPSSLTGYSRHTTAKITYCIPDGIQGDKDPCPGSPFQGGLFEAYLPLNPKGRSLLLCLEKAFHQGLTFIVSPSNKDNGGGAKVTWGKIPHKTRMEGGKSRNGYPDSAFLSHLSEALVAHGIEVISQDQAKF